jgi:Bacterial Ig-like domain
MAISISDLIKQNTAGQSEGFPLGVPQSYNWYQGWNAGGQPTPPAGFTALEGWGQVYPEEGAPTSANANANVEIANAKTYVHIQQTGQWVLVQDQSQLGLTGGHFSADFAGNSAYEMPATALPGGGTSFGAPPDGYNDHFWYGSRGTYDAGTVDGVYVQMDMRATDPNAKLVGMVGVDWWRDAGAPFLPDHSTNPGVGGTNWVGLSTQWKTLGYYSMSTAEFQADPPPPLLGSPQSPPPVVPPDTVAPEAPQITAFTPDTGTVGDKITDATQLTLSGTAEAGSTVNVFEGTTVLGTAKASASGVWSVTTGELASGTHNFIATATDAAGNTSSASSLLSVQLNAPPVTTPPATSPPVTTPPVTSPPDTGANLLVNGSFEASTLPSLPGTGGWGAALDSVPGWTAISGSKIELWNNLIGVQATDGGNYGELDYMGARDGFYQDVKTVAGQSYDLTFDARSRPGTTAATSSLEVVWNGSVVATVPPGDSWQNYDFTVVGTGGQDRLTIREVADQGSDGVGALYDNFKLVPKSTSPTSAAATVNADHSIDLMKQYAATSLASTGPSLSTALTGASANNSADLTLVSPLH